MDPRLTRVTSSGSQPPAVKLPKSKAPWDRKISGVLAFPARGIWCLVSWGGVWYGAAGAGQGLL